MADASSRSSMIKMDIDDAHELYKRIVVNQANQLTDKDFSNKSVSIHNIEAMTTLATQIKVVTKKLDNLTPSMNMVHQL